MKKIVTLVLGLFIATGSLSAQSKTPTQKDGPVLQFKTTSHNFGKIKEEDGPVSYTFTFKNAGNKPLILTNVQPSCGCTVADWSKEEIQPNGEGYVKATYDVVRRPGTFHKSITIYSNTDPNVSLITFSGDVIPKPKTLEDSFQYAAGNLRYELNHINFAVQTNNIKDTTQYLSIVNTGKKPITIKEVYASVPYIKSKGAPVTIPANGRLKLPITYSPNLVHDYGLIFDQVKLYTNDELEPEKTVSIIADIKQYIPPMSDEEKAQAAKMYVPQTLHDFGKIKEGESVSTNFSFTNKGKKELIIYKVKTTCGCTATQPEKTKLKPGESSNIKVTFNSTGKSGNDEKHITIYSNDPVTPEATLTIKSFVQTPGADK